MMSHTLFVSDLHLSADQPKITQMFLSFLRNEAPHSEALYILGDLFEYWLGDDAVTPDYQIVLSALRQLTEQGTPIYIMHGNRDFLMGHRFEAQTGCQLINDPTLIDLYGTPTLLMHGDTLCSDDKEYQQFRSMIRHPDWQQSFLNKSIDERIAIANHYRKKSRTHSSMKPEKIMDVNDGTVEKTMNQHHVLQLIHGHTHRPAIHESQTPQKKQRRIVLGDWFARGSLLRCSQNGCHLEEWNKIN